MRRSSILAALIAAVVLGPGPAHARGGYGGKSGTVMTPFGPAYNTGSPEWKQSGGNVFVYQQLMEQKMFMQQQQMLLKQQQQMMKQNKGKTPAPNALAPPVTIPHKKKKKRRTYDPTRPVTSPASKPGAVDTPKAEPARPAADATVKAPARP